MATRPRILAPALLLGLGLAVGPAAAEPGDANSAAAIRACVEANFPVRSSLQHIALHSVDRSGGDRELAGRLHWKRFERHPRAMIRLDAPDDLKGASYLVVQPEGRAMRVYVYMPALKKVRRITATTALGQLWGTDFSYEDMRHLQTGLQVGRVEYVGNGEVRGRVTQVLETHLDPAAESPYQRVVSHIDRESCVALRTEFFERGDTPRKVLEADPNALVRDGHRWLSTRFEMRDAQNQTATVLTIERFEMDAELPDRLFSPKRLGDERL